MSLIDVGDTEYTGVQLQPGPTVRLDTSAKNPHVFKGEFGGRSSVVERQLPKLYVVGSIPTARSIWLFVRLGVAGA